MLVSDGSFNYNLSTSPHSIGLQSDVTTPGWADGNYFVNRDKNFLARGMQGLGGMGCTSCSQRSLNNNGMVGLGNLVEDFSTMVSNLSIVEWIGIIGVGYLLMTMLDGKRK